MFFTVKEIREDPNEPSSLQIIGRHGDAPQTLTLTLEGAFDLLSQLERICMAMAEKRSDREKSAIRPLGKSA